MYGLRGLGAEAMGPPRDPALPVEPPDVQQQLADVWDYLLTTGDKPVVAPSVTDGALNAQYGVTHLLNENSGKIAIGAAAFLALVMVAKAGR